MHETPLLVWLGRSAESVASCSAIEASEEKSAEDKPVAFCSAHGIAKSYRLLLKLRKPRI